MGEVWHAEVSPDGSRIVTASGDKTARLWDSEGNEFAVLAGHTEFAVRTGPMKQARHAAFSPDGSRIVSTSSDNTARVFKVFRTTQELIDRAREIAPRQLTSSQRERFFLDAERRPSSEHPRNGRDE